jgi:DNA-binding beta-propeller fold protein YncE/mono/diheme cytochrome c family protein
MLVALAGCEPSAVPVSSNTLALVAAPDEGVYVGVVLPDADLLVVLHRGPAPGADFRVVARHAVCDEPRSVAPLDAGFVVSCRGEDTLAIVEAPADVYTPARRLPLPRGARPFGVATRPGAAHVYATLSARGSLARVPLDGGRVVEAFGFPDARGLAWTAAEVVVVTRWRSRDGEGLLWRFDTAENDLHDVPLPFDPAPMQPDATGGGLPNLPESLAVSPDTGTLAVAGLLANVGGGAFRDGHALTSRTTVQAMVAFLDLGPHEAVERADARRALPPAGMAQGLAYTPDGESLYVGLPGAREIVRLSTETGEVLGRLTDAGHDLRGLLVTPDGRTLLADASLDRALVVYDLAAAGEAPVARVPLLDPADEPLPPDVLLGKILFHDAADPRLSADAAIACAHCHPDAEDDGLTWDFTDRGEGLRNTVSLLGRTGSGHGPIHWSGNFDEIQDFEHDLRGPFGGLGLLPDAVFHAGGLDAPLGAPKAGAGAELDALAAYVATLDAFPASPHRTAEGGLSEAAARGRALFESAETRCLECHGGPALTDSAFIEAHGAAERTPLLHDVGTLGPGSGQRAGGPLTGLDTPTLHGLWDSAPYLHDGSAPTLRALFTDRNAMEMHGHTSMLDTFAVDDLVEYLKALDGRAGD